MGNVENDSSSNPETWAMPRTALVLVSCIKARNEQSNPERNLESGEQAFSCRCLIY